MSKREQSRSTEKRSASKYRPESPCRTREHFRTPEELAMHVRLHMNQVEEDPRKQKYETSLKPSVWKNIHRNHCKRTCRLFIDDYQPCLRESIPVRDFFTSPKHLSIILMKISYSIGAKALKERIQNFDVKKYLTDSKMEDVYKVSTLYAFSLIKKELSEPSVDIILNELPAENCFYYLRITETNLDRVNLVWASASTTKLKDYENLIKELEEKKKKKSDKDKERRKDKGKITLLPHQDSNNQSIFESKQQQSEASNPIPTTLDEELETYTNPKSHNLFLSSSTNKSLFPSNKTTLPCPSINDFKLNKSDEINDNGALYGEDPLSEDCNINESPPQKISSNALNDQSRAKKLIIKDSHQTHDIERSQFNTDDMHEAKGDGNCLFRAFEQLSTANENNHRDSREIAVDYIKKNRNDFENFIVQNEKTFEDYLKDMAKDGTWGGEIELSALSSALKCQIWVHVPESDNAKSLKILRKYEPKDNFGAAIPTYHLFYNGSNHYNSLGKTINGCQSTEQLLQNMPFSAPTISEKLSRANHQTGRSNQNRRKNIKSITRNEVRDQEPSKLTVTPSSHSSEEPPLLKKQCHRKVSFVTNPSYQDQSRNKNQF